MASVDTLHVIGHFIVCNLIFLIKRVLTTLNQVFYPKPYIHLFPVILLTFLLTFLTYSMTITYQSV